ncbi:hypothetical protein [Halapricum salinum]|uniref:Uncharacterized protein n=1 Tax=Halapricum salinum TaxID=1457250 RepID=A0A4D6HH75_9EURY|nr:hypothetical protein [Halapricum salinum]QCC52596.1 hypothetical protein DV733_15770 [Halapricum salinum]
MRKPAFGGHPSETHFLWSDDGGKRFDAERLQRWCDRHDLTIERDKRVDHDRGDELREQYRIVVTWADGESESFDMGGEEWSMTTQETPRTFVEIDSEGMARVASLETERVLDLRECWTDGAALCFKADGLGGTKRLPLDRLR